MSTKTYSMEEVHEASVRYFKGDELAARVWVNKYAMKDSHGNLFEKTPDDMHKRIAKEVARIEKKYPNPLTEKKIYDCIKDFTYIVPQGGPMTGIGNNFQVASLSNCFVVGVDGPADSYGAIMRIDEEQVQLMKRRGGVGHDLSGIRPEGSPVKNSALTSTGVVPFMERYSNSTREVAQDGRRGALMLSISIKHPDSEKFIDAKMDKTKVTGANVSVRIDDEFLKCVEKERPYVQQYPLESTNPKFKQEINASALWKKIVDNAWSSAEPGILFWDAIINNSIPDCYADLGYKTVSTNPCGEIPLCPYDSCRLLAINLYSYVVKPFTEESYFDFDLFAEHVHIAQRMMDNIIDLEIEKIDQILDKIKKDPEDKSTKNVEATLWRKIKEKAVTGRRTGVGVTAEGDMLAALGLQYGTDEAIDFSVNVHKRLAVEAYRCSVNLAKDRGPFPIYATEREVNNPLIKRIKEEDPKLYQEMAKYGRRNIALLTIAPTGSTSIMTQTSSGLEPVFMPVYQRRRKVNPNDKNVTVAYTDELGDAFEEYTVFHHHFKTWMKVKGYDVERNYTKEEVDELIKESPYFQSSAEEIDWVQKVKMQGAVQQWVDHSISVTINLPNEVKPETVGELYLEAWKAGCKGITVYRAGSRSGILVAKSESKEKEKEGAFPPVRPKELECDIVRFQNNKERWIAFVGLYKNAPYEIFTGLIDEEEGLTIARSVEKGVIVKSKDAQGQNRYDLTYITKFGEVTIKGLSHKFSPEYWNYAKLISGVLRYGMPIEDTVDLINSLDLRSEAINTWKNGVVRALKPYIKNGTKAPKEACPSCGSKSLIYEEGCLRCQNCGASKC